MATQTHTLSARQNHPHSAPTGTGSPTAEQLVSREVHYCVSSLVSTLAGFTPRMSGYDDAKHDRDNRAVMDLTAQAQELSYSIPDCEEAARQAGWSAREDGTITRTMRATDEDMAPECDAGDWQEACNVDDLEPNDREVYEHWIVSGWLADKLEANGEKVDRDFAGMIVWARTTTGQSISVDLVFEQIAADLARECRI